MIDIYYCARPTPPRGAYAHDPALLEAMIAEQYYGVSEEALRSWATIPAAAVEGAPKGGRIALGLATICSLRLANAATAPGTSASLAAAT